MSFSFKTVGSPSAAIAEVGKQAANQPQVPQSFADAVNEQLGGLPGDSTVTVTCHGHTGWGTGQTAGRISLHVDIDCVAAKHPAASE